jgi:hypothetical protein
LSSGPTRANHGKPGAKEGSSYGGPAANEPGPLNYIPHSDVSERKLEQAGEKLHNEKLHNLYSTPCVITVTKSRMRWAGHVACVGETRNAYGIFLVNLNE